MPCDWGEGSWGAHYGQAFEFIRCWYPGCVMVSPVFPGASVHKACVEVFVCSHGLDAWDGLVVDGFQDLPHVFLEGLFIDIML